MKVHFIRKKKNNLLNNIDYKRIIYEYNHFLFKTLIKYI